MNFKFTVIILTLLVIFMATIKSAPVELSVMEKRESGGNGGTHCCETSPNVPSNE
jgi:hypothetical protein